MNNRLPASSIARNSEILRRAVRNYSGLAFDGTQKGGTGGCSDGPEVKPTGRVMRVSVLRSDGPATSAPHVRTQSAHATAATDDPSTEYVGRHRPVDCAAEQQLIAERLLSKSDERSMAPQGLYCCALTSSGKCARTAWWRRVRSDLRTTLRLRN